MPQNLKAGDLITFRRMFKDQSPRMGEIIFIGLHSVVVKTGVVGDTGEMKIFVELDHICRVW